MKVPEILSAFHTMPTCDRLDLICRLLRSCVPYELRFLGTVLLDAAHAQMKSFSALEVVANQVNHYAGFKSSTHLTHQVCEKLCCALAVVHAHNNPVAEAVCGLLDNPQVLQLFDETSDVKVLNDLRLLYVMAVNHPALSFNQRQQLLYRYLQRMDSVYRGKRKLLNLSSSTEVCLSSPNFSFPLSLSVSPPYPHTYTTLHPTSHIWGTSLLTKCSQISIFVC
jgi:hypothetical protein